MDLEAYDRAHAALMFNTDREWKRHSLKHFAIELCDRDRRTREQLVSFEYGDMLVDLLELLYKRAQRADLRMSVSASSSSSALASSTGATTCAASAEEYYRLLYAIYVKNKDFK